jgi:uncharacterized protein YndB with AHSA1/START domain
MNDAPPRGDRATVSVGLPVAPAEAFRLFTEEVNLWWRRGRRFRHAGGERGLICIEPGVGGRLFESFSDAGRETVVEIGRVQAWEPPHRLVFSWRNADFAPHESTEVEVMFRAGASGTLVTVVHRGWSGIRADHPVRHGQDVPAFIRTMGLWWGDLLSALRLRAMGQGPADT